MESKISNLQIDERSVPTDFETEYAGLAVLARTIIDNAAERRQSDIEVYGKPLKTDKGYVQEIFRNIEKDLKKDGKLPDYRERNRAKEYVMEVYDSLEKCPKNFDLKNVKKWVPKSNPLEFAVGLPETIEVRE